MIVGRLLIAIALAVACSPAAVAQRLEFDRGWEGQIESQVVNAGQVVARVELDGQDAGWWLVDSGAGASVIELSLADRLSLPEGRPGVNRDASGAEVPYRTRHADSLRIGPVTWDGPRLVPLDLSLISDRVGFEIGGILGYELFREFVIEITPLSGKVEIFEPRGYSREAQWQRITLEQNQPLIPVTFEGHRGVFILDTGSNGMIAFEPQVVQQLGLLEGRETRRGRSTGSSSVYEVELGTLEWIEIAGQRMERVPAQFERHDPVHRRAMGNVGMQAMRPYTVVFDYSRRRVAFVERAEVRAILERLGDLARFAGRYAGSDGIVRELMVVGGVLHSRRGDDGPLIGLRPVEMTEAQVTFQADLYPVDFEFELGEGGEPVSFTIETPGRREIRAVRERDR